MGVLGGTRGQSEVIAVVLLLAITVVGTTGVILLGNEALDGSRDAANVASAEHGMTQFDSKVSLVAHGDSEAQTVEFGTVGEGTREVHPDRGWMNVTVVNRTTGDVKTQLMNVTLGAVTYERGDTTIAYQGGGVWRSSGNGSSMLSPPEFHYQGTTLTLPLVVVEGDGSVGQRALISQDGPSRPIYPNESANHANPLEAGKIVVTVHSEFYEAWGRFFARRTGGEASIDHGNETATIELITPGTTNAVGSALSSSSAGDEVDMSGSGNHPAFVDAYNSSKGNYSQSKTSNGTLLTAGSVDMSGNAKIKGNVRAGASVEMSGSSNVSKTVHWTTGFSASGSATYGGEEQIDGVEAADPLPGFVDSKVEAIRDSNDNGNTSAIENERLNFTNGSVTLSGADTDYYLEKIDADSDKQIVIEPNGGTTEIAIANSLQLDPADIRVEGDGVVRFYVADDIQIKGGSNVSVPGQDSTQLWIYGEPDDSSITIEGDNGKPTRFVGVIYVPSTDDGDVSIKHADVFGAIVGGDLDIQNGGVVHYDEALKSKRPLPVGANVPKVTYLHVSVTTVTVEDD